MGKDERRVAALTHGPQLCQARGVARRGLEPDGGDGRDELAPQLARAHRERAADVLVGEPGRRCRRRRGRRDAEDVAVAERLDLDVLLDVVGGQAAAEPTGRLLRRAWRGEERGRGLDGPRGIAGVAQQGGAEEGAVVHGQCADEQLGGALIGGRARGQEGGRDTDGRERDQHHDQRAGADRAEVLAQHGCALVRPRGGGGHEVMVQCT